MLLDQYNNYFVAESVKVNFAKLVVPLKFPKLVL